VVVMHLAYPTLLTTKARVSKLHLLTTPLRV
jgi:hypothetical protein